ncbi:MAG: aminotransferase class IV [Bacteroidetes bacterium]|nr:aminotransferase class IV [Bacteroidota bacterium]
MNLARQEIWKSSVPLIPGPEIKVPSEFSAGVVRCNIYYDREINHVSFKMYDKHIIRSLKMVNCGDIDYHLKYADRSLLESLFRLRETSDEIMIVKDGLLTDTSMSNLIFFDGQNWHTPAQPLLKGTCRNRLVAEGRIFERDIRVEDLGNFAGCKLINAMRDPDEEVMIPVSEIS